MWWIKTLQSLLQALQAGHELSRPAAWKNVQLVASLLTALLGVLWSLGFKVQLMPDDIFAIAGVIVALINAYLVIATSKKVGIPSEKVVREEPSAAAPNSPDMSAGGVRVQAPANSEAVRPPEERSVSDQFGGWGDR